MKDLMIEGRNSGALSVDADILEIQTSLCKELEALSGSCMELKARNAEAEELNRLSKAENDRLASECETVEQRLLSVTEDVRKKLDTIRAHENKREQLAKLNNMSSSVSTELARAGKVLDSLRSEEAALLKTGSAALKRMGGIAAHVSVRTDSDRRIFDLLNKKAGIEAALTKKINENSMITGKIAALTQGIRGSAAMSRGAYMEADTFEGSAAASGPGGRIAVPLN
ncbi:MAG: hypothetical protein OEU95_01535 [Nitrospirota bacterium]|nr:hypothetical protein [Nitrospirota bacterium]